MTEGTPGWHFWQIDGWGGVWSKYHWLTPTCTGSGVATTWHAWTACGRSVYPEFGGQFVPDHGDDSKGQ